MKTQRESNVDYVMMAKAALRRVEELTEVIENVEKKTTMCREAWRNYGLALLEKRKSMPSTKEFGAWVHDNKLDVGIVASNMVRSNAIWMAENWAELQRCNSANHHPTSVRQECRDAGYAWAFGKAGKQQKTHVQKTKPKVERETLDDYDLNDEPLSMETRWQNASAGLLGDILAARASWKRQFGNWQKFEKPSSLVLLAKQVEKEVKIILAAILEK